MESFFPGWLARQRLLLDELLAVPLDSEEDQGNLRPLLDRVFAHYHEYYHEKNRLATRDPLLVFSPSWLSPYERTFLWITGWKPSLAFSLLRTSASGRRPLTAAQGEAVLVLQRETGEAERELEEQMARVQEAMAMPQVLGMVRGPRDGELRTGAVEAVVGSMRVLAEEADALRTRTVSRLTEILTSAQMVEFLTAAAQLHLRVREWGQRREAGREAAAA